MDEDIKPRTEGLPRNLETISVEEMHRYIADLKLEIFRTEAEIARRADVRGAAEAFFKRAD